jgi:hypothetical protein
MKRTVTWIAAALLAIPVILTVFTSSSALSARPSREAVKGKNTAASSEYTLTVLNPQGSVKKERDLAPRLDTLAGKKVAMWLSATPDQLYAGKGAELYYLLEGMLIEKYPNIRIVSFTDLPMKFMPQNEVVEAIVATKPDAVVAGFGG